MNGLRGLRHAINKWCKFCGEKRPKEHLRCIECGHKLRTTSRHKNMMKVESRRYVY